MRIQLFSLLTCLFAVACADHRGEVTVADSPRNDPVQQPDGGSASGTGGSNAVHNQGPAGPSGSGGPVGTGGGTTSGGTGGGGSGGGGGPVPEPSTLLLVGTGLAGAALLRRRRDQKKA